MNQFRASSPYNNIPVMVKNLLIINVLAFVATITFENSFGFSLIENFGLYNWQSDHFKPFQLLTHMFLHGSFTHIFFNMFALWMFGSVLENHWGPKRFLTYYFLTGLGAAALHLFTGSILLSGLANATDFYLSNPNYASFASYLEEFVPNASANETLNRFLAAWSSDPNNPGYIQESILFVNKFFEARSNIPTVGASGAVFGLLLGFGMLFPNTVLMLIFPPIPIKAKYFVIIYGAIELYLGLKNNVNDNVAHFAHLGGMIFGFLLIRYWNKNIRNSLY
ncbi:MAG: rhomboid family intramembrane serine protease [Flavobacteriales bacterium]